jgi:hypothetical protein
MGCILSLVVVWRPISGAALRRVSSAGLMPAAVIAVHQLRYWAAFGSLAPAELQRQGHSYLHSLAPWIVLSVAVALGSFLRAFGRALGGSGMRPHYTISFAALWLTCSACLLGSYVLQEFLEGLFATGHPTGLAGIFGFGGAWSIPAALAVGLVLAAVFHGARWVLREVSERRAAPPRLRGPVRSAPPPAMVLPLRLAQVAIGWSDRGPPR